MARPRNPLQGERSTSDLVWAASLRKAERLSPGFDV